ncbi:MFS transporter [Shinella fusca]|uniref:MFS family permease n=1 Tax=Shinella fusca TaxID=544480 RepID=A0A7W7YWM6_9HYPH|nr:MFS transporter [Shinella fusca]MBB5043612.1 MFS family permease [Shinella fusca]
MTGRSLPEGVASERENLDWWLMLPLFAIVSLYAAGIGAVLPVLPFYLREMGASPLVFGLVLATEALSQSAASPLLGQLSDRFGRKRVLLASQAVAIVSLLLLALAQSIFTVLLARFLFGFTAGNFSAAAAYAADNSSPTTRRQAIGVVNAGLGLGAIVGAGLSSILSEISLTAPIYMALALSASGVVVTAFGLKGGKVAEQAKGEADQAKISLRAITSLPVIRVLIIVMLCHFFAYGMYTSQLPIFLADRFVWNGHALGPREFSYIIAADGVINIFVQLFLLGWLGRFFPERRLIVLIFALICTGFVSAGLASTIPVLAFAVLCISTGDALAKPTYLAALSVHVPSERQGVVMGTGQALVAVTDITSPVLAGFILGLGLYGAWIGAAVAIAVIGAAIAIIRLPR